MEIETETADKTINNWLPVDHLVIIFEYLEKKDLLRATRVCKV